MPYTYDFSSTAHVAARQTDAKLLKTGDITKAEAGYECGIEAEMASPSFGLQIGSKIDLEVSQASAEYETNNNK